MTHHEQLVLGVGMRMFLIGDDDVAERSQRLGEIVKSTRGVNEILGTEPVGIFVVNEGRGDIAGGKPWMGQNRRQEGRILGTGLQGGELRRRAALSGRCRRSAGSPRGGHSGP